MTELHTDPPVIDAAGVLQRFGRKTVLQDVSLTVRRSEIHALLGPNGAGKTTTLRILSGLIAPTSGAVRVAGQDASANPRELRRSIGLVPSGDRSFYLRLSGLENLVFFARLNGFSRRAALERSHELLEAVGLAEAAREKVGLYSHGMQKRLSAARALIASPALLLVDEATHDLDPEGARQVRRLVSDLAATGTAVVWATQRLDEIRGFADRVTVLRAGRTVFSGTVPQLLAHTLPRRFVLRVRNGGAPAHEVLETLRRSLGSVATIDAASGDDSESFVLDLCGDAVLGDALRPLAAAPVQVLACREERSEIEEAFLSLTGTAEER